jgi:aryl-alcohol dehydrogenase-like predicted oxidoreductase
MEKKMTRRHFVSVASAGTGMILLKTQESFQTVKVQKFDPLSKVTLGKSGIETTLLGMGTGYSGYNRTSAITRSGNAEKMIRAAWERGIRFFDCADSYGTHLFAASALKGIPRDSYVLSSKIWLTDGGIPEKEKADANVTVDRFRSELNTDYIDLVQIHCMTDGNWTNRFAKQMDLLENLKAKGVIRAHGVSVHSIEAMQAAAASPWVDVMHVRLNPYGDSMDKKDPQLVLKNVESIHNSGKGIIAMKLIGNGNFRNDPAKIDASLSFVLNSGAADVIIVGFEQAAQIDDYIERVKDTVHRQM